MRLGVWAQDIGLRGLPAPVVSSTECRIFKKDLDAKIDTVEAVGGGNVYNPASWVRRS